MTYLKPLVKVTLTGKGTDEVWTGLFLIPLRREQLDEVILDDIKKAQDIARKAKGPKGWGIAMDRSSGLARLRMILQHALSRVKTHDIVIGGVTLGRIQCDVVGEAIDVTDVEVLK